MNVNITVLLFNDLNEIVDVYYGESLEAARMYHEWVRVYGSNYVSWVA